MHNFGIRFYFSLQGSLGVLACSQYNEMHSLALIDDYYDKVALAK